MHDQLLKGHLPILVLGIIREEPIHGYALARKIKQRGGNILKLGDGTLYPLLYRLENEDLIRSTWETGPTGKERKVYRITQAGRRRMARGKKEWESLCRLVREFMGEDWETA